MMLLTSVTIGHSNNKNDYDDDDEDEDDNDDDDTMIIIVITTRDDKMSFRTLPATTIVVTNLYSGFKLRDPNIF